ncbi:MAG: anthranilate synthase component I family protein [Lachnospiraceae bacterium]|nr:anthranilate synthase component I family protein [Lachnospiraceae bacterium]
MNKPEIDELRRYRDAGYRYCPIKEEIFSDIRTPIEVLRILKERSSHVFLLESVENQERWGRYTFLGYEPTMCVTCTDGELSVTDPAGLVMHMEHTDHPADYLAKLIERYRCPAIEGFPSFTGGLVGYFAFDYIKYSEPGLKLDAADEEHFRDVDLMFFDRVICFDNLRQKILIIAQVSLDDIEVSFDRAEAAIKEIKELIIKGTHAADTPGHLKSDYRALFDEQAYCSMVEKGKEYIYEGDIFQVVLSNRLEADFEGSLLGTYRVLRTINPSPYMFYFCGDDMEVAGASPETLVKCENGVLHTFPLAGTRPRGRDDREDAALEAELLADEKELAEHNMLVDLGRNDLGRISRFGSVEVEKYMSVERYSHVMHIGSTVRGLLRPDLNVLSAIDAVLPAGTLSGAPKIRACEIINELENNKRGIYGGAIGYIDLTGNLDTCIAIRIAYKKNGKVFVRSGAGIVADSDPGKEYRECINKAKAVMESIRQAGEEMEDAI